MAILFFDSEFTGLQANARLISLAFIADSGEQFYAEFNDFNHQQVDDWITNNVLVHCKWVKQQPAPFCNCQDSLTQVFGDSDFIAMQLKKWLGQFKQTEIWADCPAWDWVLLCELLGGSLHLPSNMSYMVFDLATLLKVKGLPPEVNRQQFANLPTLTLHNALSDAQILKACYEQLMAQQP